MLSRWSKRKLGQSPEQTTSSDDNTKAAISAAELLVENKSAHPSNPSLAGNADVLNDAPRPIVAGEVSAPVADSQLDSSTPDTAEQNLPESSLPESSQTEETALSDLDMPAIDAITRDTDISCFFNKGVSNVLRQRALKHLFGLPAFNIRDGLNDYDEDYTNFEPLGDTITSDMKFHAARKARLEEEQRLAALDEASTHSDEAQSLSNDNETTPEPRLDEPRLDETRQDETRQDNPRQGDLRQDDEPEDAVPTSSHEKTTELFVDEDTCAGLDQATSSEAITNHVCTPTSSNNPIEPNKAGEPHNTGEANNQRELVRQEHTVKQEREVT